jgi:hypothetical protein
MSRWERFKEGAATTLIVLCLPGGLALIMWLCTLGDSGDFDQQAYMRDNCATHGGLKVIERSGDGSAADFVCEDGSSGWVGFYFNSTFSPATKVSR